MPKWMEEDDREQLTDEKIQKDIRHGGVMPLVLGAVMLPILALTWFAVYSLLGLLRDYPAAFWLMAVLLGALCLMGLCITGVLFFQGIRDLWIAGGSRFSVASDNLEDRKEGQKMPAGALLLNVLIREWLYPNKPYLFIFSGGTYRADARLPQFYHSSRFSARTEDMFRHGQIGDPWWVVTGRSGRILRIYPADMFTHKG